MKTLDVSYTILATLEVPDDADEDEMNAIVSDYAAENDFLVLVNDIEYTVRKGD